MEQEVSNQLLRREQFRTQVFQRDGHKCIICGAEAKDAHHIIERRLFDDGGYYLDNGSSLCNECHILAEDTTLSCDALRKAAGINNIVLPPGLDECDIHDKWGNVILQDGTRLRGELFWSEPCQKVLGQAGLLHLFCKGMKHPKLLDINSGIFDGKDVVHLHCSGKLKILECDEFDGSVFVDGESKLFSIWDEEDVCLSWEETIEYAFLLNLSPVSQEGSVTRISEEFRYMDFRMSIGRTKR